MTKTLVLLCVLVVAGAAGGVIYVLGRLATDLHRTALALDSLASRMVAVEDDLGAISDDVAAIADDVNALAESFAEDEDDEPDNEAVRARQRFSMRGMRSQVRAKPARSGTQHFRRLSATARRHPQLAEH